MGDSCWQHRAARVWDLASPTKPPDAIARPAQVRCQGDLERQTDCLVLRRRRPNHDRSRRSIHARDHSDRRQDERHGHAVQHERTLAGRQFSGPLRAPVRQQYRTGSRWSCAVTMNQSCVWRSVPTTACCSASAGAVAHLGPAGRRADRVLAAGRFAVRRLRARYSVRMRGRSRSSRTTGCSSGNARPAAGETRCSPKWSGGASIDRCPQRKYSDSGWTRRRRGSARPRRRARAARPADQARRRADDRHAAALRSGRSYPRPFFLLSSCVIAAASFTRAAS